MFLINCTLWESSMLQGIYFLSVEPMRGKYRKVVFLFYMQCLDEHILPNSLLHIAYMSSARCEVSC